MSFLSAEWRKLILINYSINPKILQPYLPYGTELDFYQSKCFVSLVGFMFLNTRLVELKIPFHTNFEEVNLRFYVKRKEDKTWKRGVVFIKEIVPKPALTFVANTIYNENYQTLPMRHEWRYDDQNQFICYEWKKDNKWNSINVETSQNLTEVEEGSLNEFITEHYWGYASVNEKKSNQYEVTHPKWQVYEVKKFNIDVDFNKVYGSSFGVLQNQSPYSVILAEGSEITVEAKTTITERYH